ncbi:Aste57867_12082 [Aphanomyces stellatus]|uniref:Aste57867_12082 protein n=1 Tax=Aphanomyces stellatus TaxID=120398 RepID=A0A485KWM7_9STRA|nr:hypothetical protein As57867_012037 [Aphanomyces stellatus]VFT88937.1 Aste57867_12082 [Aphanomyces stellatus]
MLYSLALLNDCVGTVVPADHPIAGVVVTLLTYNAYAIVAGFVLFGGVTWARTAAFLSSLTILSAIVSVTSTYVDNQTLFVVAPLLALLPSFTMTFCAASSAMTYFFHGFAPPLIVFESIVAVSTIEYDPDNMTSTAWFYVITFLVAFLISIVVGCKALHRDPVFLAKTTSVSGGFILAFMATFVVMARFQIESNVATNVIVLVLGLLFGSVGYAYQTKQQIPSSTANERKRLQLV